MKKILLIVTLLVFSFRNYSQGILLPVYYTIPPTAAGCDGVIALDASVFNSAACPGPLSYSSDCSNFFSAQDMVLTADTLYITNVCSLPCSLYITSAGSSCVYCIISLPATNIGGDFSKPEIYYDEMKNVFSFRNFSKGKYKIKVIDVAGRIMESKSIEIVSDDFSQQMNDLPEGFYLFSVEGNNFESSGRIARN